MNHGYLFFTSLIPYSLLAYIPLSAPHSHCYPTSDYQADTFVHRSFRPYAISAITRSTNKILIIGRESDTLHSYVFKMVDISMVVMCNVSVIVGYDRRTPELSNAAFNMK